MVNLPLIPRSEIVLPGGRLPLRVFEGRYIDMVRDCLEQSSNFGICLHSETAAKMFPYGTSVEIVDWNSDESGVLVIVTRGIQTFRTINTTQEPNGLLVGEVEMLPSAQRTPVPAKYSDLVELLRFALLNVGPVLDYKETDFADSVWVGNRLVEALPMSPEARYKLATIEDPIECLDALQKFTNNWHP